MKKPISYSGIFLVLTLSAVSPANAAIVSVDWKIAGDSLITRDGVSGLDWLDLTETIMMTRLDVLAEIDSGGMFEGWRYATADEVVSLWSNFGIDLSAGAATRIDGYIDPAVLDATTYLGNISHDYLPNQYPSGAYGATSTLHPSGSGVQVIGAYTEGFSIYPENDFTQYVTEGSAYPLDDTGYAENLGHYLVQSSVVPIPAAVWLFGSGLLGLIGVAKRKKG